LITISINVAEILNLTFLKFCSNSFIFLQLYYSPLTSSTGAGGKEGAETNSSHPILVPSSIQTAIKNLDRIPPYETHKIGVIYVGRGQANKEAEILANEHGSVRYMEFLQRLGRLISLNEVDTRGTYIGGLEVSGEDGKFAYMWKDDVLQVKFLFCSGTVLDKFLIKTLEFARFCR